MVVYSEERGQPRLGNSFRILEQAPSGRRSTIADH